MPANIMRLFLVGVMLSFGASSIHRLNTLFIGTDHQQFLSYNSNSLMGYFVFPALIYGVMCVIIPKRKYQVMSQ